MRFPRTIIWLALVAALGTRAACADDVAYQFADQQHQPCNQPTGCQCGSEGCGCCSCGCGCNGFDCSCRAYGCCCSSERLLGLFYPTDCRFNDFISPMTNPVYFEDPRNLTEARLIFLNHQIPGAVLGGGDVQLLALQIRAALTERLSLIATK